MTTAPSQMTTAPSQMTQQVTQQLVDLLAPPASVAKLTQASRLRRAHTVYRKRPAELQKSGHS